MEELSIYNLTITSDHRLKVNNEELTGDGAILPGDSESLLAWALVQVGHIQQNSDSDMALSIEDQRPDGYGVQKVTIPPGKKVLIGQLRKQTGRDLSYITAESEQGNSAPPQAEDQSSDSGDQWAWDEGATEPPDTSESEPEAPVSGASDDEEWEDSIPAPPQNAPDAPTDDRPVLAPPPSLAGIPDTPAHVPEAPLRRPRGDNRVYEDPQPPTSPIQTVEEDHWAQSSNEPQQETDIFPQGWGESAALAPEPEEHQPQDENEELPPVSPFVPQPEVTEHEDIKTKRFFYKRSRPELGEDEAEKVTRKEKPKVPRSKPMIAAIVVLSLLVVFLGIQFMRSQGENSYVATCVDERTMVRTASDTGCKNEEASYYRWWYTPSGSEVPAVNQTVAQDEGTRIRPEDATIREGFAKEGGPYGGEEEEEG